MNYEENDSRLYRIPRKHSHKIEESEVDWVRASELFHKAKGIEKKQLFEDTPNTLKSEKEIGQNTPKQPRIIRPPMSLLRRIAEFAFPKKVYSKVFETTLNDAQHEYIEALSNGHKMKARWVRLLGTFTFWWTVCQFLLSCSIGKLVRDAISFKVEE